MSSQISSDFGGFPIADLAETGLSIVTADPIMDHVAAVSGR
ncbi:hypothetical protein VB636_18000 [Paracoccus sp. APAP_BH8]